jgi:hypothetical protein
MIHAALGAELLALAFMACSAAAAAAPPTPLFADNEVLRLTIQGPIATLARAPASSETPVAGSLSRQGAAAETLAVALSPRGITRRKKDVCKFPPLRVEFSQPPPATSLFRGQKGLKLVTHCRPPVRFQQHLLLEFAAYRLYNQLTPASFNVRLAMIDYVDEAGRPIASRYGFFIEDADDMARRNDLHELEDVDRVPVDHLRAADAARFAVFQHMIGNLDWSMRAGPPGEGCCHNARLVGAKGATTGLVPVPYDFDFSGLVDAPYATPPPDSKAASVRVRRYRGYCGHNEQAKAMAADLLLRRGPLLAVLDEAPQVDPDARQKAAAYLGGFFEQIAARDGAARLVQTCVN